MYVVLVRDIPINVRCSPIPEGALHLISYSSILSLQLGLTKTILIFGPFEFIGQVPEDGKFSATICACFKKIFLKKKENISFYLFILIRRKLLYNIVMVLAIHQYEWP